LPALAVTSSLPSKRRRRRSRRRLSGRSEQLERAHVDRAPSLPAGRLVECVEVMLGDEVVRDARDKVGREPYGLLVHPRPIPDEKGASRTPAGNKGTQI
jgi:hypothetical protein